MGMSWLIRYVGNRNLKTSLFFRNVLRRICNYSALLPFRYLKESFLLGSILDTLTAIPKLTHYDLPVFQTMSLTYGMKVTTHQGHLLLVLFAFLPFSFFQRI